MSVPPINSDPQNLRIPQIGAEQEEVGIEIPVHIDPGMIVQLHGSTGEQPTIMEIVLDEEVVPEVDAAVETSSAQLQPPPFEESPPHLETEVLSLGFANKGS